MTNLQDLKSMSDDQVKKKIINTISKYEQRCRLLDDDIDGLKNSMVNLCHLTTGINDDIDDALFSLKNQLNTDVSVDDIQQQVKSLVKLMMRVKISRNTQKESIQEAIARLTSCFDNIALSKTDERERDHIVDLIEAHENGDLILDCFNQLLNSVLQSFNEQVLNYKSSGKKSLWGKTGKEDYIGRETTQSLQELISHLMLPQSLEIKALEVSNKLNKKVSIDSLGALIDDLTELVISAFNLEQKKLKNFLKKFSSHLCDMEAYLTSSSEGDNHVFEQTKELEVGIHDNIQQIHEQIDSAQTMDDLVEGISGNLLSINQNVKMFREQAQIRLNENEKQTEQLKQDLARAEAVAEDLKLSLSYHKERANRDGLTNLPNRESYDQRIMDAYHRWKRGMGDLTIAVGDIDFFKKINDTYGHLAGDKVLKNVASLLKSSIRSVDFVARYGGEEFVIVFEKTDSESAQKILEKIREAIQECKFHCKDNRVIVTMSFGAASWTAKDSPEEVFHRADSALYEAKKTGRNKVVIN